MTDTHATARAPYMRPRLAGYVRVSSERGRSDDPESYRSIPLQRQIVEALATAELADIVEWYVDEDWSGDRDDRPEYTRMCDDLEAGRVDGLVAATLDRYGRKPGEVISSVERWQELGRRVIFGNPRIDTLDELVGPVVLALFAALAGMEQRRIGLNWRRVVDARIGELAPLAIPYGYVRRGVNGDGAHTATLVPDDEELGGQLSAADVVRLIFALRVEQRLGWSAIADELNARDVRTPTQLRALRGELGKRKPATRWSHSAVYGIVENVAYLGTLDFKRYERNTRRVIEHQTHERAWPALIDDADVFEQAQATTSAIRNGRTAGALLKGLVRCAHCARSMRPSRSGETLTYQCSGGDRCSSPSTIKRERLDAFVVEQVHALLLEQQHELSESDEDELGTRLERELKTARSERRAFMRRYGALSDGDEDVADIAREHDERVAAAQRELERHEATQSIRRTTLSAQAWLDADHDERRLVLPGLLDAVFVAQSGKGAVKPIESRAAIAWAGQAPRRLLSGSGRSIAPRSVDLELIRAGHVLAD
jgi:hypothetical protein